MSEIDINLEELMHAPESLYLERKCAKISSDRLANEIASFANANGGVLVVGITDDGIIEGFNPYGSSKLNELQKAVSTFLRPEPIYHCNLKKVKNNKDEDDRLLIFDIEPTSNHVIRNTKGEVYCRQGDSSIKLNANQIKNLEYDRRERDFETEIVADASLDDIDWDMVELYRERLDTNILPEQILRARGFIKEVDNKLCITKAGMLLFGKNPSVFMPSARVRVLRFEGDEFQVGEQMNIVKDKTFDSCLYKSIDNAADFIRSQLREFTHLTSNGKFETVPEYPEFAWYEGLVNAVTHRDYSNSGEHITIKLFNNRLEIYSPGGLGGFITLETMKTKRYSRNPQIARVLTEMGIVRELNEGVKRIYSEMENFFLNDPLYSEPDNHSLLLVLENNIVQRSNRKAEIALKNDSIRTIWPNLNNLERKVLMAIYDKGELTSREAAILIDRTKRTVERIMKKLIGYGIVIWSGSSPKDRKGKYILKTDK